MSKGRLLLLMTVMTVISIFQSKATLVLCCIALSSCSNPSEKTAPLSKSELRAKAVIEEAYKQKQVGKNGLAMTKLEEALGIIASGPGSGKTSAAYASCLDDMASVNLRTGNSKEAQSQYKKALGILGALDNADPRLVNGIEKRLAFLSHMENRRIACAEPSSPKTDSSLPYFPDVEKMQLAIGTLNPKVAGCAIGIPEAVTVRVFITGDGKVIHAKARGPHADSDVGTCVVKRLMEAVPGAELPRFRACFRGFTYPFMVGKHRKK